MLRHAAPTARVVTSRPSTATYAMRLLFFTLLGSLCCVA
jgi:hypothetical protein